MIYNGENGFNCCMSTLILIDRQHPLDGFSKPIMRIASNFGGGIADWGDTCGVLCGAAMAFGLIFGADGEEEHETYLEKREKEKVVTQEFFKLFTKKWGRVDCRGLVGCEDCSPEVKNRWYEDQKAKGLTHCDEYIDWSAETALKIIDKYVK